MTTTMTIPYDNRARMNLSTYMGNKAVDANAKAMTQQPKGLGSRHAPLPHIEFSEIILDQLKKRKLTILQVAHSISKGNIYFGMAEIAPISRHSIPIIAWRASHNQRVSATIYIGAACELKNIIVLTNEVVIQARQTKNFSERLPGVVGDALDQLREVTRDQHSDFMQFKRTKLSKAEACEAMIDMVRENIIPPSRIGEVISTWDNPDPADSSMRLLTVWRLFVAVAGAYTPRGDTDAIGGLISRSPRLTAYCKGLVLERI